MMFSLATTTGLPLRPQRERSRRNTASCPSARSHQMDGIQYLLAPWSATSRILRRHNNCRDQVEKPVPSTSHQLRWELRANTGSWHERQTLGPSTSGEADATQLPGCSISQGIRSSSRTKYLIGCLGAPLESYALVEQLCLVRRLSHTSEPL